MELLDCLIIILALALLAGCAFGFCLFLPWLGNWRSAEAPRLWVFVWAFGWGLQATGWATYFLTYQRMDQYPKPVVFSKDLICLSFLLWIVAFSLHRRVKVLGVLILSGFLAASVAAPQILLQKHTTPPSDQELIANFQRHQPAFDQLLLMAQADKGLSSVSDGWTVPDDLATAGVSQGRVDRYHELFKVTGLQSCITDERHRDVSLCAWGIGSALDSDTLKGYAYLAKPPANVLNILDDCQPDDHRFSVEAYRHIQGDWYLFYEYIPG